MDVVVREPAISVCCRRCPRVCDTVSIENNVVIGDRVTIKSGVQLWDGLRVGDDVFIGPNAKFTNDPFPRGKIYEREAAVARVEHGAWIGANATVLPGLTIGARAMVGTDRVVTHDVPPGALLLGNSARVVGDVGERWSPAGAALQERAAGRSGYVARSTDARAPTSLRS